MGKNADEKIAIVTGGNSGIGEAVVKMLAERNFTVVVAGRRQQENKRVAKEANNIGGGRAVPRATDVSLEEDCVALVRDTAEKHGRLDLLVNNAGVGGKGAIVDTKTEDFDKVMKTNLYSAYWCSREAFRLMLEQDTESDSNVRGSIINTASVCGVDAWAGISMYAASKHGMMGLNRALADEGAEKKIRVAAVCPAMVATPMTGVSGPDYISPEDVASTIGLLLDLSSAAWPTEIVIPRRGAD